MTSLNFFFGQKLFLLFPNFMHMFAKLPDLNGSNIMQKLSRSKMP